MHLAARQVATRHLLPPLQVGAPRITALVGVLGMGYNTWISTSLVVLIPHCILSAGACHTPQCGVPGRTRTDLPSRLHSLCREAGLPEKEGLEWFGNVLVGAATIVFGASPLWSITLVPVSVLEAGMYSAIVFLVSNSDASKSGVC
jgi:hypothetical protein